MEAHQLPEDVKEGDKLSWTGKDVRQDPQEFEATVVDVEREHQQATLVREECELLRLHLNVTKGRPKDAGLLVEDGGEANVKIQFEL